jgi:hypothetical protein
MTFEWTQSTVQEVSPLGHVPVWFTGVSPALLASCFGPDGDGWTLKRTELFVNIAYNALGGEFPVPDPLQMIAMSSLILGEVYEYGSTSFPDPTSNDPTRAVISAALPARAISLSSAVGDTGAFAMNTDGFVTSQGQRGPGDYGGGRAQINFGIWTTNCFNEFWPGGMDAAITVYVRALWHQP